MHLDLTLNTEARRAAQTETAPIRARHNDGPKVARLPHPGEHPAHDAAQHGPAPSADRHDDQSRDEVRICAVIGCVAAAECMLLLAWLVL
jgi:hypothetical protein